MFKADTAGMGSPQVFDLPHMTSSLLTALCLGKIPLMARGWVGREGIDVKIMEILFVGIFFLGQDFIGLSPANTYCLQ